MVKPNELYKALLTEENEKGKSINGVIGGSITDIGFDPWL